MPKEEKIIMYTPGLRHRVKFVSDISISAVLERKIEGWLFDSWVKINKYEFTISDQAPDRMGVETDRTYDTIQETWYYKNFKLYDRLTEIKNKYLHDIQRREFLKEIASKFL